MIAAIMRTWRHGCRNHGVTAASGSRRLAAPAATAATAAPRPAAAPARDREPQVLTRAPPPDPPSPAPTEHRAATGASLSRRDNQGGGKITSSNVGLSNRNSKLPRTSNRAAVHRRL